MLILETHGYSYENIYIYKERVCVYVFPEVVSWNLLLLEQCRFR